MTLVLLILAVIWAAVLIPPALRARAEGRPSDSITAFHRQLAVLRRTGPRATRQPDWVPTGGSPSHRHVALVAPTPPPVAAPVWTAPRPPSTRSVARRRRRDVFSALLVAAGTTLLVGAVPAMRMLWLVHVAVDVLLIGYVSLLVRQRNLATERQLKVRLLPTARRHEAWREAEGRWVDGDGGWLAPEPALLRRSAN